jgi:four helix bundle protein
LGIGDWGLETEKQNTKNVVMEDSLENLQFYQMAMQLWDDCWKDTEILIKDYRGKEIAKQLIRSVGSISANIEEGYGRGYGKEYPQFIRISRGSARESKGWYIRSKFLLPKEIIKSRIDILESIIKMETKTLSTLSLKLKTN